MICLVLSLILLVLIFGVGFIVGGPMGDLWFRCMALFHSVSEV